MQSRVRIATNDAIALRIFLLSQPSNLASQVFYDKLGFKASGSQWIANETKQVSLQVAELA
jgi:predicted GNAT superfamily acetyltransferase